MSSNPTVSLLSINLWDATSESKASTDPEIAFLQCQNDKEKLSRVISEHRIHACTQTHTTHTHNDSDRVKGREKGGSPGPIVMQMNENQYGKCTVKGLKIQCFFISTSIHPQPLVLSQLPASSKDLINGCHVSAT